MTQDELAARLATAEGNAAALYEIVQGLIDLNTTLIDLLVRKEVISDEEMSAALQVASMDFDGGMGAFIINGVQDYLQDGDTRLVRLAQAARVLRQTRRPPKPPKA